MSSVPELRTEPRDSRSESHRTSTAAAAHPPVDRRAALRAGSTPVPRSFLLWLIIGFAVLGIGGLIAERLVGNAGVETAITTPPATLAGTGPAVGSPPSGPAVPASPAAVIGLQHLPGGPAPAIALRAASGAPWSLADARGKVVVLSFVNAECNDICPVLASEIDQSEQLLGSRSDHVQFVVVNTDPQETSLAVSPPALTQTALGHLANVTFVTGSLPGLSHVWMQYGISVAVSNTTRVVSHNDSMYFINPAGRSVWRATPFANESPLGIYSLDPATVHAFARGIADAAGGLIGEGS
jgi:cytochrome oxidase Cu insertion factor (SCO1/SenC/PrrC family)